MGVEISVFGTDERVLHQIRELIGWREEAAFARELIDEPSFTRIDPADGWRCVACQLSRAGQIAAVYPQHCSEQKSDQDRAVREQSEDRAEERKNEAEHERPFVCRTLICCRSLPVKTIKDPNTQMRYRRIGSKLAFGRVRRLPNRCSYPARSAPFGWMPRPDVQFAHVTSHKIGYTEIGELQ